MRPGLGGAELPACSLLDGLAGRPRHCSEDARSYRLHGVKKGRREWGGLAADWQPRVKQTPEEVTCRSHVAPSRGGDAGSGGSPGFFRAPRLGDSYCSGTPGAGLPRRPRRTAGEGPARPLNELGPSSVRVPLLSPPRYRPGSSALGCLPTSPVITASSPRRTWTITCVL